tara:strand:- start:942 stop:1061 length:120 start_codon:yes stop_codon:yes gene_type:complete
MEMKTLDGGGNMNVGMSKYAQQNSQIMKIVVAIIKPLSM